MLLVCHLEVLSETCCSKLAYRTSFSYESGSPVATLCHILVTGLLEIRAAFAFSIFPLFLSHNVSANAFLQMLMYLCLQQKVG